MADEALVQAMVDALRASNYAGWRRMVAGYKNADGSITMTGAGVGKVWARSPEDSRGGTAVWGSAAYANAPLIVGPGFDGDYEVKSADWLTASISFGEGSRVITEPPGMSELVPDSIPANSLKTGRVELSPNGGLNFRVGKFAYVGGKWTTDSADQDASSFVPGTVDEVCWVAPYLDPNTNTVSAVTTTPVYGQPPDLDEADIDTVTYPADAIPLGPAFTLVYGQTQLSASRFAEDTQRIWLSAWDATGGGGSGSAGDYLKYEYRVTSGTNGGTATAGSWETRPLNTEAADAGGHGALSSNQVTLAAGTYRFRAWAFNYAAAGNACRWYNITDAQVEVDHDGWTYAVGNLQLQCTCAGEFTIAAPKVFELQGRVRSTKATDGMGANMAVSSEDEVYAVVELWKVA